MPTDSTESRAARHVRLGRRMVASVPAVVLPTASSIRKVAIVGGGLMGTGIATALVNADLAVSVVEPGADARTKARDTISANIGRDLAKGRIDSDRARRRMAALRIVPSLDHAGGADLFIEAVFEDMAAKRDVFEALDAVAGPDAVLASNTSTLDLDVIASFTRRPERVIGLHFFSPANIMKLLEVVRGARTSGETIAAAMGFATQIGKTGVLAGVCDGFIGNRIFEEYLRQAWFLLEEGALPHQIDAALQDFGMAMGPCRVMDLAGQDIGWKIRKRRAVEQPDRPYSRIPDLICEQGRYGQKVGLGFYRYPDRRTAEIDPGVETLIRAESARIGVERRRIAASEIVERCIFAMINEGARVVEEGIALRPIDVDIVYVDGYGFPAARGGPMYYADQFGLTDLLAAIRRFAAGRHGWAWEPARSLIALAKAGQTFAGLNQ